MTGQLLLLLTYILIFAAALAFVALGGMFSERSGIINIGLEGIMVMSGFIGLITLVSLSKTLLADSTFGKILIVVLTILAAILTGILYSGLLSVLSIKFNADQTLTGAALNLIATAIAMIFTKRLNGGSSDTINYNGSLFTRTIKFGEGKSLSVNIFLLLAIITIIVSYFVLYKTRFGLRLRSCGENPNASVSVGINVKFYRYFGVGISGALGGLGALAYVIPTQQFWNASTGVAGFGFLALAIMIFGQWKPIRISIISLVFSVFLSISYIYNGLFEAIFGISLTAENGVTPELFKLLPFIASLILLIFTSKKSRAPKAEGIPFDVSKR